MASFKATGTLYDFQKFIGHVYGVPDDRKYSIWDLLVQQQRFAMRSLKGLRKGGIETSKRNLLISLSWLMAMANRLHINMDDEIWHRFPYLCSYCAQQPCICKEVKPEKRTKLRADDAKRPDNLAVMQKMFDQIYPASKRTLAEAGIHLAEEVGEVSEAIHNYMGEHKERHFKDIKLEAADFFSCTCGVANSANIDLAQELSIMYRDNCHVCHQAPCACKFSEIIAFRI